MKRFDWNKPVQGYTEEQDAHKRSFHNTARSRLKLLAAELGLPKGSFDIRSNMAGPAVSGEVTLHGERIYVQVSSGTMGPSILYRTCEGRKDYTGGRNNFMPLVMLDDIPNTAEKVRRVMGSNH